MPSKQVTQTLVVALLIVGVSFWLSRSPNKTETSETEKTKIAEKETVYQKQSVQITEKDLSLALEKAGLPKNKEELLTINRQPEKIDLENLYLSGDDNDSLIKYGQSLLSALSFYKNENGINAVEESLLLMKNGNEKSRKALTARASDLKNAFSILKEGEVPPSVANIHVQMINLIEKMSILAENMSQIDTNQEIGLLSTQEYAKGSYVLIDMLYQLNIFMAERGISFIESSPQKIFIDTVQ